MVHMLAIQILYTTNTVLGAYSALHQCWMTLCPFCSRVRIDDRQETQWSVEIAVETEAEEAIIFEKVHICRHPYHCRPDCE
jgi:hypothetical protein